MVLVYADRFGRTAFVARAAACSAHHTGAILSPMSAFLLLQGIETVSLRIERHVDNARAVAEFLRGDARVGWVNYAGFPERSPLCPGEEISGRAVPHRC